MGYSPYSCKESDTTERLSTTPVHRATSESYGNDLMSLKFSENLVCSSLPPP